MLYTELLLILRATDHKENYKRFFLNIEHSLFIVLIEKKNIYTLFIFLLKYSASIEKL